MPSKRDRPKTLQMDKSSLNKPSLPYYNPPPSPKLLLNIIIISCSDSKNKVLTIKAKEDNNILHVKNRIAKDTGHPIDSFKLYLKGSIQNLYKNSTPLKNHVTLGCLEGNIIIIIYQST